MQRIASFTVDHTILQPGIYISRVDGDITTYDLRQRKPNADDYLDHSTMHTFEHLFATYIRNDKIVGSNIIYFGPMGCQTGAYLLVRNTNDLAVFEAVKNALRSIINHQGEVFGNSEVECGNFKTLDLDKAKAEAKSYLAILETINNPTFKY
ncbi:MAG: S-ribosylhomocysteine lyase [Eubacteriales bacterium]|nr:S-ribosylhomocysteine lyase [Eubacteriales bacterium]